MPDRRQPAPWTPRPAAEQDHQHSHVEEVSGSTPSPIALPVPYTPPMSTESPWKHSHTFGQHLKRPGESRTILVIAITAAMMIVEIAAGLVYGSMALLADGLHMASHAAALSINAFAYIYARRHAHDERYSFGTGKVNTLGGYTGAVLLAVFAVVMVWESLLRFISPVDIAFNQAIFVAVLGLVVNGVSVLVLGHGNPAANRDPGQDDHHHHHGHHDHNLVSAYLHVLADALTSLLAILALLTAKYFGWIWADPAMGVVGAILVARWSLGLLHSSGTILLDRQAPEAMRVAIRKEIERHGDCELTDLHVWAVGPRMYSVLIGLVSADPQAPEHYKRLVPKNLGVVHINVEVHRR
jgi:cation diffusion facilitator family transporter